MNTDNNPSGTDSVSVDEAAEQLLNMTTGNTEAENETITDDVIDGESHEADADTSDEQPEADSGDDEADANGDDDETDIGDEPAAQSIPDDTLIEIDGKMEKLGDLKRRGMFQSDYTKKTTELKAEREQFYVQRDHFAFQLRQSQAQGLREVETILNQFLVPQPDPSLLNDAPAEYQRLDVLRRQQLGAIEAIRQQYAAHEKQNADHQAAEHKRNAAVEYEKFYEMHPSLDVRNKGEKEVAEATALYHYGAAIYGNDAMVQLADSNMMSTLYKAMLWDRSQKAAAKVAPKVAQKPPMARPSNGIPRTASDTGRKALDRVRQTGSMEDAITAYLKNSS